MSKIKLDITKIFDYDEIELIELLSNKSNHYIFKYRNKSHFSLLMHACKKGYIKIVELFLENSNFDIVTDVDHDDMTAFMYACLHGHFEIIKLFLKYEQIHKEFLKCKENFMYACQGGNIKIVKLLMVLFKCTLLILIN